MGIRHFYGQFLTGSFSILDCSCGDMSRILSFLANREDINFTGYDTVQANIENNKNKFAGTNWTFEVIFLLYKKSRKFFLLQVRNLVTDHIPKFDLILCRQIMMHMTITDILKVMRNIYISGSTYLLATNFPETMVWYAEKVFLLKQINFSLTLNLMKMIMKDIAHSTFTFILSTSPLQSAKHMRMLDYLSLTLLSGS